MEHNGNTFVESEGSNMAVPYLTSFLCCMSLKVGSKITSILHFLVSASFVVACSVMAADARQYMGSAEDADGVYTTFYYGATVVALVSVVHVLLACLLFYGVFWRRPNVLRVWVIVMCCLVAAAVLFVLGSLAVGGLVATGSDIFIGFIEALVAFVSILYCILCVYSYYLMLRSAEDLDRPNKVDY